MPSMNLIVKPEYSILSASSSREQSILVQLSEGQRGYLAGNALDLRRTSHLHFHTIVGLTTDDPARFDRWGPLPGPRGTGSRPTSYQRLRQNEARDENSLRPLAFQ